MTPPQCAYTDGKTYFDRKGRLDDWESGHDGGANQLFCLFNFQCQVFFLKKNKNFKKKKKKGVVKKERELPRGGIKYVSETGYLGIFYLLCHCQELLLILCNTYIHVIFNFPSIKIDIVSVYLLNRTTVSPVLSRTFDNSWPISPIHD